jgi:hypothetical protein
MRHISITIIPEKIPVHGENMSKNNYFIALLPKINVKKIKNH